MRTLKVSISDLEFNKFGIKTEVLNFTEIIELVSKELARQNLNKSLELAEKFGLSSLSMDDISNEVKIVRDYAKNRN
jgi:hypothetical protein